jgi:hypothetical protein
VLRLSLLPRARTALIAVATGTLLLAGAPLGATAHAAASRATEPKEPLTLRMTSITPDYIPDHGPIVIRGRITNTSTEEWTAINVHAFLGTTPITTPAELATAATTPILNDVGHRITVPGTFDHFDALPAGATRSFEVRLPRSTLAVSTPGVYWFGVHALGASPEGRPVGAVGRDRTFLPLIPNSLVKSGKQVDTALVVPLRAAVTRASDGRIEDSSTWLRNLRSGPLHSLVDFGRAAQGRPLTWILDPAVPDAVRQLAAGNPARTLESAATTSSGQPSQSPTPSGSAAGTAGGGATLDGAAAVDTALDAAAAGHVARVWLRRLHQVLAAGAGEILGLPYGDLAVDTASRYDLPLLRAGFQRTGHSLAPWGLPMGSVVAPPEGRLPGGVVATLPRLTKILLADGGVTGSAAPVDDVDGRTVVLASSGAASGGPGPVDPLSALALRQRILSEAALRLLGNDSPLVVEVPPHWNHLARPSFFTGLDVPWLRLTTLDTATAVPPAELRPGRLRLPSTTTPQLAPELYGAANGAIANAHTLQSVLPGNRTLAGQIFDEIASNASYAASADPYGSLARVQNTGRWVTSNLAGVHLQAPESVTLASASGRFSAQVSNDLDVPVTVHVQAQADSKLQITGGQKVQLPPHGRYTVLLNASTHVLGVHTVTLQLTNSAGTPLGSKDVFPMRAEQVSKLIWVIIGAGLALLFGAIVIRLARRIVRSRA